ncbi:cobalamin B12-binding domain-containing protein [Chloroflexota bacterium]
MKDKDKNIRILLAQFSLETHSRGVITVAGMLRDSGMEVILIGNSLPEQIAETAMQEDVDVVGVSTLTGGELILGGELLKAAEKRGIKESKVFLMGGIYPPMDMPKLKEMGFDGLFMPGATQQEIVSCIEQAIASKGK